MRRAFLIVVCLLEVAAAGLLLMVGLQLPSRAQVEEGFGQAEALTGETVNQVGYLRESLDSFNNPQLGGLREASQGLGSLAQGMEAWASALDPQVITRLREGTGQFAGYLDQKVAPAAAEAAQRLEELTATLKEDAEHLAQLLKETPPDFKAAKEVHESLGRFGEGLDKVSFLISEERLKTMREGFKGMEQSLDTGADQVERLAGYTYPVVKFNGLKPEVDEKAFWPEGDKIAEGMRKGAKAMREANKEFEKQAETLPQVQKSLDESKKTIGKLRDMLGKAVANQDKVEGVLKTLPANAARMAKDLPALADRLRAVLRETQRLSEISAGLRDAQKLLASAEKSWPEARRGLLDSAEQLRALQKRLDEGLDTPTLRLQKQQRSLDNLTGNLEGIRDSLPAASDTVGNVVTAVRWLLWVIAAALALHACYLLAGSRSTGGRGASIPVPTPGG